MGAAAADQTQPYTLKAGDLRVLVKPSMELDWSDNVTLTKDNPISDFILRPLLELTGSYPLSQRNLFRFDIGVGYDWYLQNNQYSALRLLSGSEMAFEVYVKDFRFNLHDRFQYVQDPAEQASVATTGRYGGLENNAGLDGTWDLRDVQLTLGYDHQNFVASSSEFAYLNRASEKVLGRMGLQPWPRITTGVEAIGYFTTYEQEFLNNNKAYEAGLFAQYRPGAFLRLEVRGGYTAYAFEHTSQVIRPADHDAMYAAVTLRHDVTRAISYSLTAGHELRLGTSADLIDDYYVRPSLTWNFMRNLTLTSYMAYEHGRQGAGELGQAVVETYDWLGTGLTFSYSFNKRLVAGLRYRLTLRSSDAALREYAQELAGVQVTYSLQ